jgi:hypothetical protein
VLRDTWTSESLRLLRSGTKLSHLLAAWTQNTHGKGNVLLPDPVGIRRVAGTDFPFLFGASWTFLPDTLSCATSLSHSADQGAADNVYDDDPVPLRGCSCQAGKASISATRLRERRRFRG